MQILSRRRLQLAQKASVALISILIVTGTSCLQRISVPIHADALEGKTEVLVTLKSGKEVKVSDPTLDEYRLRGMVKNQPINIDVSDIALIEYRKPDFKRFALLYTISMTTLLFLYLALTRIG